MAIGEAARRLFRAGNGRLAAVEQRSQRLSARVDGQKQALAKQSGRLDRQAERLDTQHTRLAEIERRLNELTTVYLVLEHQMASLETRMDRLDMQLNQETPDSTAPERAEARGLLDQMRDEHSRIRARFGVITRYEERIRRLERALEPEPNP